MRRTAWSADRYSNPLKTRFAGTLSARQRFREGPLRLDSCACEFGMRLLSAAVSIQRSCRAHAACPGIIVAMKASRSSAIVQPFELVVSFRFLTQQLTRVKAKANRDAWWCPRQATARATQGLVSQLISAGGREQDNRDRRCIGWCPRPAARLTRRESRNESLAIRRRSP